MDDKTLVRSFDSLEAARAAVDELVGAGIARDAIALRVLEWEAGPGQGNFAIGNGQTTHGGPPKGILAGPEMPYDGNFRHTVDRGVHLVQLAPASDQARRAADAILERAGGRAVQDIADRALQRH